MSAKVTDGWSLRALQKILRMRRTKLRQFIGTGMIRVRAPRIPTSSLAVLCDKARAYSGDVIGTFRRDVNSHSDDVNKVGAQRRWGCNHATSFCQQSRGTIIHHHFVSVLALYMLPPSPPKNLAPGWSESD